MLNDWIQRLEVQNLLLEKLLVNNRKKRGLINAVGNAAKTLFGTLTESDLEYAISEIDKLYRDNKVIATSISNQMRIIKSSLNSASFRVDAMMEHSKEIVRKFNE